MNNTQNIVENEFFKFVNKIDGNPGITQNLAQEIIKDFQLLKSAEYHELMEGCFEIDIFDSNWRCM